MAIAICFGLLSCSEEKSEPLPDLPAVTVPAGIAGSYSGQLPCDNCKAQIIRAVLAEDSSATIFRTVVNDSAVADTLQGKFSMGADSVVSISVGEDYSWKFKRSAIGNLSLLNGTGEFYLDENGGKCVWVRILSKLKFKPASSNTDSSAKIPE